MFWGNLFYLVFLRQFSYVAPTGLKLSAVLLSQLPECWGLKCAPPSTAATVFQGEERQAEKSPSVTPPGFVWLRLGPSSLQR